MTLRVVMITPSVGEYGGIEAFMFAVEDAMRQEPDIAMELCFKRMDRFAMQPPLETMIARSGAAVSVVDRGSPDLLRVLRRADVVHAQTPSPDVAVAARCLGKSLVMTLHNFNRPSRHPRSVLKRVTVRLAERHWYNSDFVWRSWEPRAARSKSAKLPVVSKLPTTRVAPAERRGLVFVGRWVPNKGIEELIRAYAEAPLDRSEWPLVLVGDGPLRDEIHALIAALDVEGIETTGFVAQSRRDELIAGAKWLVAPSNTNEELGLTPIEARAVGVPVIVTRDGGLPEAGGREALTCAPGDVSDLAAALEQAARMPEEEYLRRTVATEQELGQYLRPLTAYAPAYREVAGWK